jgi:hypothetical protein
MAHAFKDFGWRGQITEAGPGPGAYALKAQETQVAS